MSVEHKMPQTVEEKIKISLELKQKGNDFIKIGEYKKACHLYNKIFLYINGLNSNVGDVLSGGNQTKKPKNQQEIEIQQLRISVHLNLSLCYLKLQNYKRSLDNVQKVLQLDPDNKKAIFRRGQSYLGLNGK